MCDDKVIADNYLHGDLLTAIQSAIAKLGKTIDSVTIDDLAPVDEFHIGGRAATERFIEQLDFSAKDHVIDVGCGLGGAARFVANKYKSRVTGIDLTHEYVETGKALCTWVKLDRQVVLHPGSALSMPFEDEIFDGGYMLHVGMNIEDKARLFKEIHRVLRTGSCFGIYDVIRNNEGELAYPVPWAAESGTCNLATLDMYRQALAGAGFEIVREESRRDFALEFFHQLRANAESGAGPQPLGLHTLMQASTAGKIKNMIDNITADYIAPVEVIAKKI